MLKNTAQLFLFKLTMLHDELIWDFGRERYSVGAISTQDKIVLCESYKYYVVLCSDVRILYRLFGICKLRFDDNN